MRLDNTLAVPQPDIAPLARRRPVVIIGMGPVGIRTAREILRNSPDAALTLYGGEPWAPYNRVKLSTLLAGKQSLAELYGELEIPPDARVVQHHNSPVVAIDRQAKTVTDALGRIQPYHRLVIATGSRPHRPAIPNIDLPGVFTFRDLDDTQKLLARSIRSRTTVVIGGGVLGLEAARALQRHNTRVWVVANTPHLMSRQLDEGAGETLREKILAMGIGVVLADGVVAVLGERSVEAVKLRSGRVLACDTVVVATGIRPNIDLALQAGLKVGRGISVDDSLRTSDPAIYAVGECVEHRGKTYGFVAPGFEQAAVAARNMTGGTAHYCGSTVAIQLKVAGCQVFSMGQVGENEPARSTRKYTFENRGDGIYRLLAVDRHRLLGAVAIGEWPQQHRVREAIEKKRRTWPWQLHRFARTGRLWRDVGVNSVTRWPASTVVCHCTQTHHGALQAALRAGCTSVEQLSRATGAGSVCGGCKPLLSELAGARVAPIAAARWILALSLSGLTAVAALLAAPAMGDAASADIPSWHQPWRHGLLKQVSGYSLLACTLTALLLSARKRVPRFTWGGFDAWRLAHLSLGLTIPAILAAHTGLRFGANLNFWLMATFCTLMASGAGAGLVLSNGHRLSPAWGRRLRHGLVWFHILTLWPLPVLLAFHILKVYYF